MKKVRARYFDGKVAAGQDVDIYLIDSLGLRVAFETRTADFPMSMIDVEYPVGHTGFVIHLPDNAILEVDESADVETWWGPFRDRGVGVVAQMERQWPLAAVALFAVVGAVWWSLTSGIPAVAKVVAKAMPVELEEFIAYQGLELLDGDYLGDSQLTDVQQNAIYRRFDRMVAELDSDYQYQLYIRDGGPLGANAFALPSGIIVLTDQLVELSEHHDEIEAVLAHEVGHVENRHTLRMIVQNSGSAALFVVLLGDINAVAILSSTIPTTLVNSAYSREFETEADDYAYGYMDRHDIARHRFSDILLRVSPSSENDAGIGDFLSSHPRPEERVRE